MPSLLPYLEPDGAKIRLDIIGTSSDTSGPIPKRFPFRVLDDSSPLTRLLRADILTDAGSLVQPVFLLIQKDIYRYPPSELWPLTNPDIEDSWQQAHCLFSHQECGRTPAGPIQDEVIRLGGPMPSRGGSNAFQSLFFCNHQCVFFHPPCPGCGQNLFLCKDDPLLLSQGLSAYSSSLQRYLYCPSCPPATEGNGFYASSPGISDPGGVRDCSGLIASWRFLLAGGLAPAAFPCLNCPERDKCHGPENLAATRMIPFGFYPFHMLVLKAMTIRAADFLALVSGASMEDVESRLQEKNESARLSAVREFKKRIGEKDLFLFDGTEKHFLEVLYLKLSFLNEITEKIQSGPAPLDIHAALDCLWVKIPSQGSFLPGLWNFSAGYMDIGLTRQAAPGRPGARPSQIGYFLGVVWFLVLLTHASRPPGTVITAVTEFLDKSRPTDTRINDDPLFAFENIFWDPAAHRFIQLPFAWKALWKKALGLAWGFLTIDRAGTPGSWDNFRQDLSAIRKEIKKELFHAEGAPAIAGTDASDDPAILEILTGIIEKWKTAPIPAQPETSEPEDILAETMLLARDKTRQIPSWDAETVIQTADPGRQAAPEAQTILLTRDEPCETIILSGQKAGRPPAPEKETPGAVDEDEILSETIILRHPQN